MPRLRVVLCALVSMSAFACAAEPDTVAMTGTTGVYLPSGDSYETPAAVLEPEPPSTTTTAAPVVAKSSGHASSYTPPSASGSYLGFPCGDDLPPCYVLRRENPAGDPAVYNGGCHAPIGYTGPGPCGGSTASGLWQFIRGTWAMFGGYVNAADAPVSVQNDKARQLWANGAGCSHWSAC